MMSPRHRLTFLLLGLVLVAGNGFATTAPPTDRDTALAPMSSQLEWQLPQGAAGAVLTVIGPDDFILRKVYEPSGVLSFSAADVTGEPLADGSYTWELRFVATPDSGLKRRVEAARAAGNDAEAERLRAQMARPKSIEPVSGTFRVDGGSITAPSRAVFSSQVAAPAPRAIDERDQVIADDLIVQGSTCVGLDCVNNESFGFDTIRLKENNTRIKFEDTSASAGFPTHDWQLTANDSASGGAEKFSIEDITAATVPFTLRGSAPTNSIFVDGTGRVGFRTATPVLDLHVSTSNTPALRLEQTNAGGFTAQTWDIAGNEANFFVRDVTGGSRLPFRIRPGAPTSSIDINASGDVGIGTASPGEKLHVLGSDGATKALIQETNGTAAIRILLAMSNNGGVKADMTDTSALSGAGATWSMRNVNAQFQLDDNTGADGNEFALKQNGDLTIAGSLTTNSDRTTKRDILPVSPGEVLAKIDGLEIATWVHRFDPAGARHLGPMAQDFSAAFGLGEDDRHVSPLDVAGVSLAGIQALHLMLRERDETISLLEARIQALEAIAPALVAAPAP